MCPSNADSGKKYLLSTARGSENVEHLEDRLDASHWPCSYFIPVILLVLQVLLYFLTGWNPKTAVEQRQKCATDGQT